MVAYQFLGKNFLKQEEEDNSPLLIYNTMKKILVVFYFFSFVFCFSQNNSIEYLVEKKEISQLFTLDINGNKSVFYSNEYCNADKEEIFNYVIIENADKENYIFHDQLEVLKVYYKQKIALQWELTDEKKNIDNVILNKAITHYKNKKWIAWYNPNISISSGPFIFGNLPGLIYEVSSDDFKISLASIKNKTKNCIKISSKEKPIDKESYDKYNKDLLETLKEGYRKKTNVFDNLTMQTLFENSIKKDLFREFL